MVGRTVVVTGGNSGIGLETAVALGQMGARVLITARDRARGEAARADIAGRIGSVYLASSPEVAAVSGQYFMKGKPRRPRKPATDPEAARRLWEISEELVAAAAAPQAG
ncbi:MAG: SDR family NAD(P)-dependent oxidoreductase [Acidimicrobiales bacterium]